MRPLLAAVVAVALAGSAPALAQDDEDGTRALRLLPGHQEAKDYKQQGVQHIAARRDIPLEDERGAAVEGTAPGSDT